MHVKQENATADSSYLAAALSYYIHQNQLMWSRLQTATAIQAAALGAGYALRTDLPVLSLVSLGLGSLLTVLLWLVIQRDRQLREVNKGLIEELGRRLSRCQVGGELAPFALGCKPEAALSDRHFISFVVFSLVAADLAMMLWVGCSASN